MHLWNKSLSRTVPSIRGGHWRCCLELAKPSKPDESVHCWWNQLFSLRKSSPMGGRMRLGTIPQRPGKKNQPHDFHFSPRSSWTQETLNHGYESRWLSLTSAVKFNVENHYSLTRDEWVAKISSRLQPTFSCQKRRGCAPIFIMAAAKLKRRHKTWSKWGCVRKNSMSCSSR